MIQNKTIYAILALAVAMLFTSCAEIDLCEDTHDGTMPSVQYSFNWGKNEADAPEQMYAMAHRIINDWKRVDIISTKEASETFDIRPGEYSFIALPTKNINFKMDELISCLDDPASRARVQDKNLDYRLFSKKGVGYFEEIDYGYNTPKDLYLPAPLEPFYYDCVEVVKQYDGTANVKFAPKPITQCIEIEYSVLVNTDNKLELIEAELSGIPVSIQIGNGYISPDKTVSAVVLGEGVETTVEMSDGSTRELWKFTARINVPTIIKGESASATDGPGILKLTAITSDKSGNGEKYTTVLNRNLYNIIDKAKLYVYTDDNEHVVKNGDNAKLEITTPFTINK